MTRGILKTSLATLGVALVAGCAGPGAVAPQVEILVRGGDDLRAHYDYVGWAPAPMLVRLVPAPGADPNAVLTVVLTNGDPAADGKGHVNFATSAAAYKAAIDSGQTGLDQISLSLKADGTPQRIVVAGDFPHFSRRDKDTAIVAHAGSPTGPELGRTALMVRVRRDEEELSAEERDRFLWALAALRFQKPPAEAPAGITDTYDYLVRIHDIAGQGQASGNSFGPTNYPDQAHKSAGFLPWHRAFLLEMERSLQRADPSVSLPYWPIYLAPQGRPARVFEPDFAGANKTTADPDFAVPERPQFTPGNPLYGWDLGQLGPVTRWTNDRSKTGNFTTPEALINDTGKPVRTRYSFMAGSVESNPHNIGHGWTGIWMSNCLVSPGDPIFWPFHGYFDWIWAAWQQHYDRFDRSGQDAADFSPNDAFDDGNPQTAQIPRGHHLRDPMWPWNVAYGTDPKVTYNARRPPIPVGGEFAPAPAAGLWPTAPAKPMPADMIDYAGYSNPADDSGVAYDSIPWSPKQKAAPLPDQRGLPSPEALGIFLDAKHPLADRLAQAPSVDLGDAAEPPKSAAIQAIALAPANPVALRAAALGLLERVGTDIAVETALRMRRDKADAALRHEIDRVRALRMFATRPIQAKAAGGVVATPPGLDPALYGLGQDGAPDSDPAMVQKMTGELDKFLANPSGKLGILPQDAVAFIAATDLFAASVTADRMMAHMAGMGKAAAFSPADTLKTMRRILAETPRPVEGVDWWEARGWAALVLAHDTDPASTRLIANLASDRSAPVPARAMALNALRHQATGIFAPIVFSIAADPNTPAELRAHAIAAVGAMLVDHGTTLPPGELDLIRKGLARLPASDLPPPARKALETSLRLAALAAG